MINKHLGHFNDARVFSTQEQTISVGSGARNSLPVQFVLQNNDFKKLREYLPKFLEEANKSSVFQSVDYNLKFNKPELDITINREKAAEQGISMMDISQTLQLALSANRIVYFIMNGYQYSVIAQVNIENATGRSNSRPTMCATETAR